MNTPHRTAKVTIRTASTTTPSQKPQLPKTKQPRKPPTTATTTTTTIIRTTTQNSTRTLIRTVEMIGMKAASTAKTLMEERQASTTKRDHEYDKAKTADNKSHWGNFGRRGSVTKSGSDNNRQLSNPDYDDVNNANNGEDRGSTHDSDQRQRSTTAPTNGNKMQG